MKKKNKVIAFMLEIINPALGFTYIDHKNQNYVAVTVIVAIMKLLFYFGLYNALGLNPKGKFVFTLVSSVIIGLPSALVSLNVVNKLNKKIDEERLKTVEKEIKVKKDNEANEINKYHASTFISDLNKIYNLKKNSLLTEVEYNLRKEAILKRIENYGIRDSAEDFLNSILVLKESNILTKDELIDIKNKIL